MRKLRVGIIGTGMAFERLHYPAYQQLADRYEIAALCDTDGERARQWAERLHLDASTVHADFREMLERHDLDVMDIMVPIELNYEVTEAVAQRLAGQRKGIICEKPLAPTMEQAAREWRQHPEFPGGAITDTAVHDMAGLRHIFGPIAWLHAFGRPQAADFAPYAVVNVNLLFKSGVTGQFTSFCAGKEMQRPLVGLRTFGTAGMIYLEERDAGTINPAFNDGRTEQIPYEPQKGFYNELVNFYNALTGTEPVSVTPEVEYGDLKTVLSILRSIREGRIVPVDEEAEEKAAEETAASARAMSPCPAGPAGPRDKALA